MYSSWCLALALVRGPGRDRGVFGGAASGHQAAKRHRARVGPLQLEALPVHGSRAPAAKGKNRGVLATVDDTKLSPFLALCTLSVTCIFLFS